MQNVKITDTMQLSFRLYSLYTLHNMNNFTFHFTAMHDMKREKNRFARAYIHILLKRVSVDTTNF